ncbi:MAG: HD-GYP domain-containing protein [Curvibacter sp.]|nr:MAG: HD-GYP domain-containing protein [Curvibacter sp.]
MLKKIRIGQLTLGMYIHEFCGSWMDHPFWKAGFVLQEPKDLATTLASSVREVWIDTTKGKDLASDETAISQSESDTHRHVHLQDLVDAPQDITPTTMAQEMERAVKLCEQSKQAVISMFQEARMGKSIDRRVSAQLVSEITLSVTRNPGALISLARLKTMDDYTYMHSVAVCALMVSLSHQLGLDPEQTRDAGLAGLLHDVGKMAIPMEVLNKTGRLTDAEFSLIKTHAVEGHRMLRSGNDQNPVVLDVCLHHHEKIDGSGYPHGLKGDDISLFAKMGAVCDVYDAITSNRPYKAGWDPSESLQKMADWSNGHFDPRVFQAFVRTLGIYPVGSLVRLRSDRLGVVVEQSGKSLTQPHVKIFFELASKTRLEPMVVDLSQAGGAEKIVGREDPNKWRFSDLHTLWGHPG